MSRSALRVVIEGAAFWAPRLPSWDIARAVIRGELAAPAPGAARPAPVLLAPTERRRAPDTVAVALEVAARACEAAQRAPQETPAVFASTHGDLAISDYMCATLASAPTLISPIKFHNSVHNAAAGYWSIGTGSYASYTAISAYYYTFAAGLLEAAVQAIADDKPVLFAAFDIEARGPLATMAPSRGVFGVALVVAPAAIGEGRGLTLSVRTADAVRPTLARSPAREHLQDNALAPALPFFEGLAHHEQTELTFALSERTALHAELAPLAEAAGAPARREAAVDA